MTQPVDTAGEVFDYFHSLVIFTYLSPPQKLPMTIFP